MKLVKKHGGLVVLLLSVVAAIMLFLEGAVNVEALGVTKATKFTGLNIIFGKKEGSLEVFKFNFLGFMAVLLLIVGAVLSFLPMGPARIRFAVATLALLLSAVFFFVFPGSISSVYKIGTPMIIAGVLTALSTLLSGLMLGLNVK